MIKSMKWRCIVVGPRLAALVLAIGILFSYTSEAVGQSQPRRARTLEFNAEDGQWAEIPPPPLGTASGDLHAIRVLIGEGKNRQALGATKKFVKRYGTGHVLYPDALLARAEALIGKGDYFKAHLLLQDFLNDFAGLGQTISALKLEFVIAEIYFTGVKRKWLGMRVLSGEEVAFEILDHISINYADTDLAPLAIKTKADYFFGKGDHDLAQLEYERLMREYPNSRYDRFSLRRAADAALASYTGLHYDERPLLEAEARFHEFRLRYPGHYQRDGVGLVLDTIVSQKAAKELEVARYYERTGHIRSAIVYYRSVIDTYPDTVSAGQSRARLIELGESTEADAEEVGALEHIGATSVAESGTQEIGGR